MDMKKAGNAGNPERGKPGSAGEADAVGGSGGYPSRGYAFSTANSAADISRPAPIIPASGSGLGDRGVTGFSDSGGAELSFLEANPEHCRDIMSKNPACCTKSDNVGLAAQIMRDQDIGSVAIVEDEQSWALVGILTDRDLVVRVLAEGRDPRNTPIEDAMTRSPVTCSPEDPISTCLDGMQSNQVRRMPVVDSAGRIVGMIAQADIAIRLHQPRHTAEVVEEISRPS